MPFTCRHFFLSDYTYIRTDETDKTTPGGDFDDFKKWFQVSAKQMSKPVSISKKFLSTNGQFAKPGQVRNRFLHNKNTLLSPLNDKVSRFLFKVISVCI